MKFAGLPKTRTFPQDIDKWNFMLFPNCLEWQGSGTKRDVLAAACHRPSRCGSLSRRQTPGDLSDRSLEPSESMMAAPSTTVSRDEHVDLADNRLSIAAGNR
jgi:hypothetical protein